MPAIIQCDGIWVRLQIPTGTIKTDRRSRRRQQHKGKRMVLLVALGLWADGSGRREILDWELAEGETQPDWQRLLDRLWHRGVRPEAGLAAVIRDGKGELGAAVAQVYGTRVIEQRCVFHKLRNVADKAREDLSGEAHRESREQLLEQASAIYQAETPAQAHERLSSFVHTWGSRHQKQWQPCNGILSRPLPSMPWVASLANLCAPRPCWNAPIVNCAASSDKLAVLVVAVELRWRSICRCNDYMPAGPKRPGPHGSFALFGFLLISTLSKGYAIL